MSLAEYKYFFIELKIEKFFDCDFELIISSDDETSNEE